MTDQFERMRASWQEQPEYASLEDLHDQHEDPSHHQAVNDPKPDDLPQPIALARANIVCRHGCNCGSHGYAGQLNIGPDLAGCAERGCCTYSKAIHQSHH